MTISKNYVPIHVHTAEGSLRDSILKTDDLVKKAKELNLNTLCMTDHGSLANMYNFYYECTNNNIKPIIGCEIYLCEDMTLKDKEHKDMYHMILLAKNNNGLKNLLKIVSIASVEGMYYKPRVDLNYIKEHSEDLICTTACVGGYAPQLIIQERDEEALEHILELKNIFNDDLFLEIQPGLFPEQLLVNDTLIEISKEHDIKLVVSNDIHYLNKEDWKAHDFHVRDGRNLKAPEDENDSIYADKCYYLMTKEELYNSFVNKDDTILEAINNTNEIGRKCKNLILERKELNLPTFKCPDGYTTRDYLEHICYQKLNRLILKIKNPNQYISRLNYELDVIDHLGFVSYFLIMRDIIQYAKSKGIKTGPGRGSAAGSLVAYLCGITQIDPIKYGLLFERFLSIHRKGSIPDVDLDISSEGRDILFNYTITKYGAENCCCVSTLGMRKSKSAVKAAGRLLGLEPSLVNTISKLIPTVYYVDLDDGGEDKKTDLSIEESLEYVSELREYQEIYPELFSIAQELEGLPDHAGIHAAGIIIANTKIVDVAPLIKSNNEYINATALDLHSAETQMLVKYDYLGLSTLSLLDKLEKATGVKFDIENDEFNDPKIWKNIGSSNTTGLFQIGSNTYKRRMPRLKPKTLNELADCLALVRGPCISSKLDEKYMRILEGKEEVELIHPMYDKAVKDTNGIMIYQEQLMNCCHNMGLPLHLGYDLMKASAKKKFEKIASYKDQLHNLVKGKMTDEIFERIFQLILDSGKYSFNKSHALAYATICYATAFYKTYYPLELFACLLSNTYINKTDLNKHKEKLEEIMEDCIRLGIKFLPVDMNKSKWEFTVENDKIRIGFCALPSFSYDTYNHIKEKCMPFNNNESYVSQIFEKTEKSLCRKPSVLSLIACGALGDRVDTFEEYYTLRKEKDMTPMIKIGKSEIELYASQEEIEYILFNINFVHNRMNNLPKIDMDKIKIRQQFEITGYIKSVSKKKDKNNNQMAFVKIETGNGIFDSVVFANIYSKYKKVLKKDALVNIKAELQESNRSNNSCKLLEATIE